MKKNGSIAKCNTQTPTSQSGVTLIEVLISLLIMSFALLGMAGMQARSMAVQSSAVNRGNIATLISDFADRARSNLSAAPAVFSVNANWSNQTTPPSEPTTNCDSTTCTATERANFDLTMWRRKVRASLPQGSVFVSGNNQSGFQVTLMWLDKEFSTFDSASGATALRTSTTCTSSTAGSALQTCCPTDAAAPAGVRCLRSTVLP